jgi:hypothetical protein
MKASVVFSLSRSFIGVLTYCIVFCLSLPRYQSKQHGLRDSNLNILCCGGVAGMLSWFPSLPIDTMKSRYQTAPTGTYPRGIRCAK